nr:hypothetical protein [Anaeroplasmataceae bacterium]
GFFSTSYFAYNIFNSFWADILYIVFLSMLYITAYVQELITSRKKSDIIINSFVFLGSLLFLVLLFFSSSIFNLLVIIYSAGMLVLILIPFLREYKDGIEVDIDKKQLLSAASLLVFGMVRMLSIEFISEIYMAWALIPTAILSGVIIGIGVFLFRKVWTRLFYPRSSAISHAVLSVFLVLMIVFSYCFSIVGTANCVLDSSKPVAYDCVVLDMHVSTGARSVTQFEIKVEVEGEERWITIPVTEYHSISKEDVVCINSYTGAFHFAYLKYQGKK